MLFRCAPTHLRKGRPLFGWSSSRLVFVQLRKRAKLFGPVEPSHFIFASFKPVVVFEDQKPVGSRITGFNTTVPIGSWRKAWGKLTAKAGLSGLRFHDLRHHAITELLTNPNVSVQTTKSIAGHVSQKMVDRYAHIQLEAKRSALEALTQQPKSLVTGVTGNRPADTLTTASQ